MNIRYYNACVRQHSFSESEKANFFINFLWCSLKTFFNNARNGMEFEEMAEMMVREFNSDSGQLQVQGMLETFRLAKDMSE